MNLFDALKQKRNLRRPIPSHLGSNGDGWLDYQHIMILLTDGPSVGGFGKGFSLDEFDILATDWEVRRSATERLQDRINAIIRYTNIHPTILDVSEQDFEEIRAEICSRPIPDKDRGWGWDGLMLYTHSGKTHIVKARK